MQLTESLKDSKSDRLKCLIVANREALNGKISGASLRLDAIRDVCTELGLEIIVNRATFRPIKSKKQYELIIFCSFSVIWVLNVSRFKVKNIWIDFTDSLIKTLCYQIRQHHPLLRIGSSARALFTLLVMRKVKIISYISPHDLTKDLPLASKKAEAMYIFPNLPVHFSFSQSSQFRFIFMGTLNYLPNSRGIFTLLDYLLGNNLEHLVRQIHVYGELTSDTKSQYPLVQWHGYQDYLANKNDVHIAPILEGAGIKNKVTNPIFNGLRVITTLEGANGLLPQEKLFICNDLSQFAHTMLNLAETENIDFEPKRVEFEINQRDALVEHLRNLLGLTSQG